MHLLTSQPYLLKSAPQCSYRPVGRCYYMLIDHFNRDLGPGNGKRVSKIES